MRAIILPLTALLAFAAADRASAEKFGLRPGLPAAVDDTTTASTPPVVTQKIDPYEALGIRAGGFILYPTLTVTGGYTSNAAKAAGGSGGSFATVEPELLLQSDWARHEVTLTLRGAYETFSDDTPDDPSGSAEATARLDLANQWTADLAAGVNYKQEDIDATLYPDGADEFPGVTEFTSSAALSGNLGRMTVTAGANVDRTLYEDTTTSGGTPVDQGDRINTVYGARLRLGYDSRAALKPFVEGAIAHRVYDQTLDSDGIARASVALSGRAGVAFDNSPLLTGEVSIGTTSEDFDDASLETLRAFTFDGTLVWSPSDLTTVTFDATTTLNPSVNVASSGSVVHEGSVEVAYAWRDNVTVNGTASISNENFQGTGEVENTYDLGAGLVWKINRALQLTAGYEHEWLVSNDPTANYQSDTVKVGLRAQR